MPKELSDKELETYSRQIVLADITTPESRGRIIGIYQGCIFFAVGIGRTASLSSQRTNPIRIRRHICGDDRRLLAEPPRDAKEPGT